MSGKIWNFAGYSMPADTQARKLPAGAYICKIIKAEVEDTERGPKLKLYIDIADGDYKDFFKSVYEKRHDVWPFQAVFTRYILKDNGFSKSFIDVIKHIEAANPLVNIDTQKFVPDILQDLYCGFIFGEEEYKDKMNITRTSCRVKFSAPVKSVKDGKCKVPALRKLDDKPPDQPQSSDFDGVDISDDDVPF